MIPFHLATPYHSIEAIKMRGRLSWGPNTLIGRDQFECCFIPTLIFHHQIGVDGVIQDVGSRLHGHFIVSISAVGDSRSVHTSWYLLALTLDLIRRF